MLETSLLIITPLVLILGTIFFYFHQRQRFLIVLLGASGCVLVLWGISGWWWFSLKWNEMGDSYNILNTLFSGLAFVGLVGTMIMQKQELELQRGVISSNGEELARQADETNRLVMIGALRAELDFYNRLLRDVCEDGELHQATAVTLKRTIRRMDRMFLDNGTCNPSFGDSDLIKIFAQDAVVNEIVYRLDKLTELKYLRAS